MFPINRITIRSDEMGLHFRDGEFRGLLATGTYWLHDPFGKIRVDIVSQRDPWLVHEKLDLIVQSGVLDARAVVVALKEYDRGLVWIDGRFSHFLPSGLFAYWTAFKEVRVEVVDARQVRFDHAQLPVVARVPTADRVSDAVTT